MKTFDYARQAELFAFASLKARAQRPQYKRFVNVAEAVRHAIEDLPPQTLLAAHLLVDEARFDSAGIRRLYESADYPLPRGAESATG